MKPQGNYTIKEIKSTKTCMFLHSAEARITN